MFEGERTRTKDNHLLGTFDLTGLPPAPRGIPQIEVTFQVDANGVLRVTALDKGTGKQNAITIESTAEGLSPEDIKRMVQDAEDFAEEDRKFQELTEARNSLEGLAYSAKRQVEDLKKKMEEDSTVSAEDLEKADKVVHDVIHWLDTNPDAAVKELNEKKSELESALHPLADSMYRKSENGEETTMHEHESDEL